MLTAVPEFIREGRLKLFLIRLPHTLQLHRCKLLLSGHIPFKHFAPGCTLFFFPVLSPVYRHVMSRHPAEIRTHLQIRRNGAHELYSLIHLPPCRHVIQNLEQILTRAGKSSIGGERSSSFHSARHLFE